MSKRIALFWAAAIVATVRPAMADEAPIGWLDVANCEVIAGWALDQDTPSTSIEIHLYDGPAGGGGVFINNYTTSEYRGDVNAAYSVDGNHGFAFQTPSQFLDGAAHTVYAYGINSNGEGPNSLLSGSGIQVTCGPPPPSPPPPPPPPPPPASYTFLINGAFNASPEWAQPGSAEYNAIAATYGYAPQPWVWASNSTAEVLPPAYYGIVNGGQELANFINSLPAGDVNLISHSHGGNVVLISQAFGIRPVRRYIQLATPVNWDFWPWRWAIAYGQVAWRCQVSANNDWIQFSGSSPFQQLQFYWELYDAGSAVWEAIQALRNGDYAAAIWWFSQSAIDLIQADYWFDTAKYEVEGPTLVFSNVSPPHGGTHEPPIWNAMVAIAPSCV